MMLAIWRALARFSRALAAFTAAAAITSGGAAVNAQEAPIVILAFGDSLTAGYQLPPDKSFPAQLEKALIAKGHNVRVLNAGVSGDTASDGLQRVEWALSEKADAAIVELGANDALRGFAPKVTEAALDQILLKFQQRGLEILLTGMEAPRNMGREYADAFRAIYPRLQQKYGTLLYPFFLEGVAVRPELNMADGIHPKAEGVAAIVAGIMPQTEALIERVKTKKKQS